MTNFDWSKWDASKAWAAGAKSDNPAAFYNAICAGKKEGDPNTQAAHALPYKYSPSSPPNAAGVRNALARLPQTQGLTNKEAAQKLLEGLMKQIQAAEAKKSRKAAFLDGGAVELAGERAQAFPAVGRVQAFPTELRGASVAVDGRDLFEVEGYATTFEQGYEMWDMFGPYTEIMDSHALDISLSKGPDVAFLVNHRGVTMARTTNNSLTLSKDGHGLHIRAYLNPERTDVRDLMVAMNDGLIDQMSFAFMLQTGKWDEEYETYTISQADIHRGDVSAVNFGANPYTQISAREWLELANEMPQVVRKTALTSLYCRDGDSEFFADVRESMVIDYGKQIREAADRQREVERSLEPDPEPEADPEPEKKPGGKPIGIWNLQVQQMQKRGRTAA